MLPALKKKVPRTMTIGITSLVNNMTYADILKKARENVSLKALNIDKAKIKRTMTGEVIIEIAEDDNEVKADSLRDKLDEVLDSSKIKVTRPTKRTQLRLSGIDDSITTYELRHELSKIENAQCF